jgi:hypothetical protein
MALANSRCDLKNLPRFNHSTHGIVARLLSTEILVVVAGREKEGGWKIQNSSLERKLVTFAPETLPSLIILYSATACTNKQPSN